MLTPLDYELRYWRKRLTLRSLAPVNALDSNQVETRRRLIFLVLDDRDEAPSKL